MPAPGVYILALMIYVAVGFAFCTVCLLLALFPQMRSPSLRAAASMIATYPGVFLYQLISLPLMAVLFIVGMIAVSVIGVQEHPNAVLVYAGVLVITFGSVSLAGFISGWRVAWTALVERSLPAGLRKDLLVAFFSRLRKRMKKTTEPCAPPNGGPATQLGNSDVTEGPPSVS